MSFMSCDGFVLVELPDAKYHDTTYVNTVNTNYFTYETIKPDTAQLSPSEPFEHAIYFDSTPQAFGFCTLDSMNSLYYDYSRESGSYTYVKTGRTTADLTINFVQRNNTTYYDDTYVFKLNFLTPCGGILNGTKTRIIKAKNSITSEFTTQSTTITPLVDEFFSFTLWISVVREGL